MNNDTPDPSKVVSPKVTAALITTASVTVVGAVVAAITPDMLTGLGPIGSVLVFAGVTSISGLIAGWLKGDPLRK